MELLHNIRTFESLAVRDYRLLWLGQLSTTLGQNMDQLSRSWLIYSLTRSPLQLGLVSATRGAPLLVFGVLAGVVADRYGRKAQLIIAQTVNAFLNAALAILILTGHVQVWHIYVTGFLSGTVQAFQQPARQVLISDLVGDRRLLNAIALNSGAMNLTRSLGPAFSGILIHAFGVGINYFIQAALFAFATFWTVQIEIPQSARRINNLVTSENRSVLSSLKEGFRYIASHQLIWALLVLGLAPTLLGAPYTSLLPIFAIDVFHGDAETQGLLSMTVGIGALLGALAIASVGRRQGSGKLLIAGAAGFGLSLVLFSRSPVLSMAMASTFLAGLSNTAYTSQNQTILQMLTPQELRGRVMGVRLLDRGLMPVGSLLAGALASLLGAPWAVTVMGTGSFLLVVGVALFVPDLWKMNLVSETRDEGDYQ